MDSLFQVVEHIENFVQSKRKHCLFVQYNSAMSEQVLATANELSFELQHAIADANAFLQVDRPLRFDHAWMRRCLVQRQIDRYLSSEPHHRTRLAAIQLATIAAATYSECGDASADAFMYPSAAEAQRIKARADGLAELIEHCRWLPVEAKTPAFKAGLAILQNVYPCKRVKGENKKGDPRRRMFIARLAEAFERSFACIPIAAITDLTAFGWPDISERAVRLVLTAERQAEIAAEVKAAMDTENRGEVLSIDVINRLNRRGAFNGGEMGAVAERELKDDEAIIRLVCARMGKLSDPDMARAAIDAVMRIAEDFGVNLESSPKHCGSEIAKLFDFASGQNPMKFE